MRTRDPLGQLDGWFTRPGEVVARCGHGPAFLAFHRALEPDGRALSLSFGVVLIATRIPDAPWRMVARFLRPD